MEQGIYCRGPRNSEFATERSPTLEPTKGKSATVPPARVGVWFFTSVCSSGTPDL